MSHSYKSVTWCSLGIYNTGAWFLHFFLSRRSISAVGSWSNAPTDPRLFIFFRGLSSSNSLARPFSDAPAALNKGKRRGSPPSPSPQLLPSGCPVTRRHHKAYLSPRVLPSKPKGRRIRRLNTFLGLRRLRRRKRGIICVVFLCISHYWLHAWSTSINSIKLNSTSYFL